MVDVLKAIAIEKEYIEARGRGEYPFHLADKLRECGFNSLGQYFQAKTDNALGKVGFVVIDAESPVKSVESIFKVLKEKSNAVIFVNVNHTMVWTQINSGCNVEYCTEHKIPIVPVGANGDGTLVSTPGDFGIGICVYKDDQFNFEYFVNGFVNIFRKYTDKEVCNQGNDIMYEGKKICGFTSYDINNMFMIISPISFSEKADLVANICIKEQKKPVGFIDFMSRDTLKKEVSKWLHVSSI